ncbi:MAG: recombination protein NinG [Methanobrevibacter sp.]|nr:recombination protein NinG [Methanobrevibacter sp.]
MPWINGVKVGKVCKWCGSDKHQNWQCFNRPKKVRKTSKDDKNKLIQNCDKLFSEYTRKLQKQTLHYNKCFICGKKISYEESQIGHYVRRSYLATRWLPEFCQINCFECNVIKHGNLEKYKERLIEEYGEEFVAKTELSKNRKVNVIELQELEKELKHKLKGLQN